MESSVRASGPIRSRRPLETRNGLLRAPSFDGLATMIPDLEHVVLEARQALSAVRESPAYIYFLESGIISFTLELPRSGLVEFGVIGREGLSSFTALREGRQQPVSSTVQVGGTRPIA